MSVVRFSNNDISNKVLNFLTPKQMRHITILEAMTQLVKEHDRQEDVCDHDGSSACLDCLDDLAGMLGCERFNDISDPNDYMKLDPNLFKEVPVDSEEQDIIYKSALATSKWHLKKLLE